MTDTLRPISLALFAVAAVARHDHRRQLRAQIDAARRQIENTFAAADAALAALESAGQDDTNSGYDGWIEPPNWQG